jgi:hypothetical protein
MLEPFTMSLFGWVAITNEGTFISQDGQPLTHNEIEDLKTKYRAFSRCNGPVPQC